MRFDELKLIDLEHGDCVQFVDCTYEYGRAEFGVCPVWKRGRLQEFYITPCQQNPVYAYYRVQCGHSDSLCIESWMHKGMEAPRMWREVWCKEHKTHCLNCYVPPNSLCFGVRVMSTAGITFDRELPNLGNGSGKLYRVGEHCA